jgi:hypothetical protein
LLLKTRVFNSCKVPVLEMFSWALT